MAAGKSRACQPRRLIGTYSRRVPSASPPPIVCGLYKNSIFRSYPTVSLMSNEHKSHYAELKGNWTPSACA